MSTQAESKREREGGDRALITEWTFLGREFHISSSERSIPIEHPAPTSAREDHWLERKRIECVFCGISKRCRDQKIDVAVIDFAWHLKRHSYMGEYILESERGHVLDSSVLVRRYARAVKALKCVTAHDSSIAVTPKLEGDFAGVGVEVWSTTCRLVA